MEKLKVLVLYNKLFHYRVPIFNLLAEKYDLTVAYSLESGEIPTDIKFKVIRLPYNNIGRFVLQKTNVYKMCSNYDVVLLYGDISWLKHNYIILRPRRPFGVVSWSIGVSASYDKKFDTPTIWNKVRYFIKHRADAVAFYTSYPIEKYVAQGFAREKLFVANNTVAVKQNTIDASVKDSILFIGTMYMQKGIALLLEEYLSAYKVNKEVLPLYLVGGGAELPLVKQWVEQHQLQHKIIVCGPVYDIAEKAKYFSRAYATISPVQAGLSVLESMGYGVPFITTKDAITGGEILNIQHDKNGLALDSVGQISSVILDISRDPAKYLKYGEQAKLHYDTCRKPIDMANGLAEAIEYAYKQKHTK